VMAHHYYDQNLITTHAARTNYFICYCVCYHEHKRLMPHLQSELMSPRDRTSEDSLCIETVSELSEGQEGSDGSNS